MSKVIVIYDSKNGFTERMAKAIVEGVESIKGVDVELHKIGEMFSISKLNAVDAIIIGSPTIYGSLTSDMRNFLGSVKTLKESKKLKLSGKIGGVFGSYGWDGGWVIEQLNTEMKALGIKVVEPLVSEVHEKYDRIDLSEESYKRCYTLGRIISDKVLKTK